MTRWLIPCAALLALAGCGVSNEQYAQLQRENATLKADNQTLAAEVDELKNGEPRLVANIQAAVQRKDLKAAKASILALKTQHPESPHNATYEPLLQQIQAQEAEEARAAQEADKERQRLANLSNTGIWEIRNYVDKFEEKTADRYISTKAPIVGTFSNSATQDSPLKVAFLINSDRDIDLKLFEYARNNPVKSVYSGGDRYEIDIKDKEGKKTSLLATNRSDRLSLESADARKLSDILKKGGAIKVWIMSLRTTTTQYAFTIDNADGYDNAYQLLTSKK